MIFKHRFNSFSLTVSTLGFQVKSKILLNADPLCSITVQSFYHFKLGSKENLLNRLVIWHFQSKQSSSKMEIFLPRRNCQESIVVHKIKIEHISSNTKIRIDEEM